MCDGNKGHVGPGIKSTMEAKRLDEVGVRSTLTRTGRGRGGVGPSIPQVGVVSPLTVKNTYV